MPGTSAAFLGGVLCAYGIAFCIWGVLSAAVLKGAIALYNAMVGGERSERGVPSPTFGKAFVIVFVTTLLNLAIGVGLLLAANAGASSASARASSDHQRIVSMLASQAISYPLGLIIMAGMISSFLPTTLGRAFLVTLCHFLIAVVIVLGLAVGVGVLVGVGVGGMR
jgi:hypothetical protein